VFISDTRVSIERLSKYPMYNFFFHFVQKQLGKNLIQQISETVTSVRKDIS